MTVVTQTSALERRALFWATGAFLFAVLLHIDRVPLWGSFVAFASAGWRIAASHRPIRLPGRSMKTVLTLVLLAAVFLMFRTLNGLTAGTALLVAMGAIKLLETSTRRDHFITVAAALFLLLAACLERQALSRLPLYLIHAWICCSALVIIAHPQSSISNRGAVLFAGRSLLFSLPLAIALFLFFPRLPGAFWALPVSNEATTGLGDSMSPGGISELTISGDPVFRVWFLGEPPPPQERYWRGPVLHEFDGYTWTRPQGRFYRQEQLEYLGNPYHYRVTLEPSSKRWWFALDTVAAAPSRRVFLSYDRQLISAEPVTEATTYEASSYTRTRTQEALSVLGRRYDTALPEGRNPRSRQLAIQMRERAGSEERFISSVLELFRQGGFAYTLTPPLLDLNSVDDFIFNTKRGFCGHYASAFAMMMRAGGVPTRVVTGYQGGEWNPIGRYFLVRQSEAHAWTEVWLDQRGWVRVDPTGVVAPERLQSSILDLLPDAVSAPARFIHRSAWLTNIGQAWDALNAAWNNRVLEFDFRAQLDILARLGFDTPGWQQLGWAFATGLTLWLAWVAWQFGRVPQGARGDRLSRAYQKLCAKLSEAGISREPHVGPLAYAAHVAAARPDLAPTVQPLILHYANLRFGPPPDRAPDISAFERAVARLRIAKSTI
jgi:protein-glutamine gamma-glutamyltransferase